MSFNAKNLTYGKAEQKEPEFLRKLKQQYAPHDTSRHNRPSTVPKRLRADDDDDPTYVDAETNEIVTQAEYENMMGISSKQTGEGSQEGTNKPVEQTESLDPGQTKANESNNVSHKENVAEVGERKKRRVGKMIGEDEGVTKNEVKSYIDQCSTGTQSAQKKRKKKIKLSFADDEAKNE